MTHSGIPTPTPDGCAVIVSTPVFPCNLIRPRYEAVFKIRWEEPLQQGPVGEYLEVVDFDRPRLLLRADDLKRPYILAQTVCCPRRAIRSFISKWSTPWP